VISVGFNHLQMHNSSAYIDKDGELLFAVTEERNLRIEHDPSFPHLVACLAFARARPGRLDFICQGRHRDRGHN
jgi:predicted NodU family carbamoyl transferase